jgi:hypothetical protein
MKKLFANLKAPQAKSPRAMGADAEIDKEIVKTITEDPLKPEIKIGKENPVNMWNLIL